MVLRVFASDVLQYMLTVVSDEKYMIDTNPKRGYPKMNVQNRISAYAL